MQYDPINRKTSTPKKTVTSKALINITLESAEMKKLIKFIQRIAKLEVSVIFYGETGTGKSLFARYIHQISRRCDRPFITVNCASIPNQLMESELFGYEAGAFTGASTQGKPGYFEIANGGTLFLDEIGELSIDLQPKLLYALETGRIMRVGGRTEKFVNVRILTATNRNLRDMVLKGQFRADLFYRLNVIPISIPPLRERIDDIEPLANTILEEFNKKHNTNKVFSKDLIEKVLKVYPWPGNVREMRNVIERLVVFSEGQVITVEDEYNSRMYADKYKLSNNYIISINDGLAYNYDIEMIKPLKEAKRKFEVEYIKKAIKLSNGNVSNAAKLLGVHRTGLYKKLNIADKENIG